jgi:hypothetical protein
MTATPATACAHRRCGRPVSIVARDGARRTAVITQTGHQRMLVILRPSRPYHRLTPPAHAT